jgi:hypothetical protein
MTDNRELTERMWRAQLALLAELKRIAADLSALEA